MKTAKTLKEERGVLDSEILELRAKYEGTDMTKEDATAFDELVERMETLGNDIESAEKPSNLRHLERPHSVRVDRLF